MLRLLLILALVAVSVEAAEMKPDVWIISGQSNACGGGKGDPAAPNPLVEMFDAPAGKWITAKEPFAFLNSTGIGAWHSAALAVAKEKIPVRLSGYAMGGRSLAYWSDGPYGGGKNGCWLPLKANIQACGAGAGVFLFYQGEADCQPTMTSADYYRDGLRNLAARVRTEAKNPAMKVVIVQLAHYGHHVAGALEATAKIREAQRQFVIEDSNAILVPAAPYSNPNLDVHLTAAGYQDLGAAIGKALLKTHYKKAAIDWPGPVMDAATISGGRVTVHFAEAAKLVDVKHEDFKAHDADGQIDCTAAQATGTCVALTFSRAIKLPATVTYGWCEGATIHLKDEAGNFAPAVRLAISEGKPPKDVRTAEPNGAGSR